MRSLQSELGHLVGFSIPYQSATSGITKIEYVTNELLLWEIMVDPLLEHRSVIILEQIHVRSLWGDALLGTLKMILPHRRDLRLILSVSPGYSSIVKQLQEYFSPAVDGAEISVVPFNIEDARVPVETYYLNEPCANFVDSALERISDLYNNPGDKYSDGGDMIVFMTTRREVEQVIQRAGNELQANNAVFFPFYSAESLSQYQAVMGDDYTGEGIWRIIVTTDAMDENYDILAKGRAVFIIDTGFRQISETNSDFQLRRDMILPISVARAESRRLLASNSDRIGKCYRLYTEQYAIEEMTELDIPETFYADLTEFSLRIMSLSVTNVATDFPFLSPQPPIQALSHALERLFYLKAINNKYELTTQGSQMADLHLPVKLARSMIAASELSCVKEMTSIAAMVLAGGVDAAFFDPSGKQERQKAKSEHEKFQVKEGDYLTLLNIYDSFKRKGNDTPKWTRERYLNYRTLLRAQGIRTQLFGYLEKQGILTIEETKNKRNLEDRICHSICKGYFLNAAKRTTAPSDASADDTRNMGVYYKLLNEKVVQEELQEGEEQMVVQAYFTSVQDISEQYVVYQELVEIPSKYGSQGPSTWYMKGITAVKSAWLLDSAYYKEVK